jgi:DNA polymerase-3 subunit delta'
LALAGHHPDLHEVIRVGASISAEQAGEIVHTASLSPVEGNRKVMVLHEFHLVAPAAAAKLLKTIEEPPARTMFVVLADQQPAELVTIASRCVRVPFRPLDDSTIADALQDEGVAAKDAADAARSAAGNLTRARILAADPKLRERHEAFGSVPAKLDGTGARVLDLVDDLLGLIDDAAEPLKQQQQAEIAALEERARVFGERGSGRKALEDRHKRELRRHRSDELRWGLAVMAGSYRDALVAGHARPEQMVQAAARIQRTIDVVERNPNEPLLLQALLLDLPSI